MPSSSFSPNVRGLLATAFLAGMLAFPAIAVAEPNPKAPAATDIKPGSLELDPNAPATRSGSNPSGSGSGSNPSGSGSGSNAPSVALPSAAYGSKVHVNIDKSTQEMTVFVDGVERYSWPVSTGTRGYSTPSGSYTASSMNEIWYSKQWDDAPMPHAIFFTKRGHAIHGTTDVKKLGRPASHGCVRLAPENAKTLFYLVKEVGLENTEVALVGTTPGGEGPKVASPGPAAKQIRPPRAYNPWFERPMPPPQPYAEPRRRGLFGFGRRFRDNNNAQGYNGPRYQYQPRGVGPRGGY